VPSWKNAAWKRQISINNDDGIIITDEVSTDGASELSFIFNLHPDLKIREMKDDYVILVNGTVSLRVSFDSTETYKIEKSKATAFIDFKKCENEQLKISVKSNGKCVFRTVIEPVLYSQQ
jgi:hypothetical protein